jgi:hypothetical protein
VQGKAWFDSSSSETGGYAATLTGGYATLANNRLVAVGPPVKSTGMSDAAGPYDAITIQFAQGGGVASNVNHHHTNHTGKKVEWTASLKAYHLRPAIVFAQTWNKAVSKAKGGSVFPTLHHVGTEQLGTLEYTGASCGFMVSARGQGGGGAAEGFPAISGGSSQGYIAIVPRDVDGSGSTAALTIGPVTEHFANQASADMKAKNLNYGLASTFESVPFNYTLETVLVASTTTTSAAGGSPKPGEGSAAAGTSHATIPDGGVNAALMQFGDFLLARHNKTRALGNHKQETEYLGYSTTAFYFYNLCDCLDTPASTARSGPGIPDPHNRQTCTKSPIPAKYLNGASTPGVCASYADTLIAVNAALEEQGVPIKHFLLDSWWYGEGWNNGVSLWEDVAACTGNDTSQVPASYPADTFPKGLKEFHAAVGLDKSIWAHNGLWTESSPYRAKFPFADQDPGGPPQGPGLWDHVFSKNKEWGLNTIKQDHIKQQVGASKTAYTNVSVMKVWMSGMGDSAAANDVGVLYCCAEPNIHMNGVTVPAAYAVRSSPDYVWGQGDGALLLPTVQWAIGPDAAFHWNGLGLLPYKDTFISNSTSTQKSGRSWSRNQNDWPSFSGYHEANAATHALMSLLSMAHVTFSDAVGETNRTLIMQLIRADGMLLKPDRPVTAIDGQFQAMMFGEWPGQASQGPDGPGSLYTSPCDPTNPMQQFTYTCTPGSARCTLTVADDDAAIGCMSVVGGCSALDAGSEVKVPRLVPGAACGSPGGSSCSGHDQDWHFVKSKTKTTRLPAVFAIQLGEGANSITGRPLCLEPKNGGIKLADCDAESVPQGWFTSAKEGRSAPIMTTVHDDATCLTVANWKAQKGKKTYRNGAFTFDSKAEEEALADSLFPRSGPSDAFQLSDQYRSAYTQSAGLMRQIEERNADANGKHPQCKGQLGAPQGPLGEVYSTHVYLDGVGGWRYIVGVQLATNYTVTSTDLNLGADGDTVAHVSYAYDEGMPGFRPTDASDVHPIVANAGKVLTLEASTQDLCTTSPDFGIKTRCFPFQLHAVAPVSSNGWVLLGETGKFLPVTKQRIHAVKILPAGGFEVSIAGAQDEVVELGAVDAANSKVPVYVTATVGADGTATVTVA